LDDRICLRNYLGWYGFIRITKELKFNGAVQDTSHAVFHQRYNTNTLPNWYLAQPFRSLAYNGEINTLQGNVNRMTVRESELESKAWGRYVSRIKPIVDATGSASDIIRRWENFLPMFWEVALRAPEEGDELVIPDGNRRFIERRTDRRL